MTEPVASLAQARKAKARRERETQAAANRAAFGRTRAEKQAAAADVERRERALDGARREP